MRKRLNNNAGVLALAALVVSLLGAGIVGANAAGVHIPGSKIKKNSITSKQLKNNGVMSADVQDGAIDSEDIEEGGVKPEDVTMPAPGQFHQAGIFTAATDPSEYRLVDSVGTFTKGTADSVLKVEWEGTAEAPRTSPTSGGSCEFQIRVNGQPNGEGTGEAFMQSQDADTVSAAALFKGLGTGPVSIEVWARTGANHIGESFACAVGASNIGINQTFIVTEEVT